MWKLGTLTYERYYAARPRVKAIGETSDGSDVSLALLLSLAAAPLTHRGAVMRRLRQRHGRQRRPGGPRPIPLEPGPWKAGVELRLWKYLAIAPSTQLNRSKTRPNHRADDFAIRNPQF